MKNIIICKSCNAENPFYEVICINCHSYLKERIFNIDLWRTIEELIVTPVNAFRRIIQSEHKNFITLMFILAALKLFINSIFISLVFFKNDRAINYFVTRFFYFTCGMLLLFLVITLLSLLIIKVGGVKTRFNDLFALFTYSLMPYSFAAIILFPIEIIIFGEYLFSVNPSPYVIKSTLAWILTGLEFLLILWSLFLTASGIFAQTKSMKFSVVSSVIVNVILYLSIYFYSGYLAL
ncbi:MAG: YIP1 family protein [Ignavibacteriaceae bacterium]|nr:YIP1 family protein [Ignavibacteriaceae bacterium]